MHYDTIVIGAGQAGLAVGYYLKQKQQNFILLDKENEVGASWRSRYDVDMTPWFCSHRGCTMLCQD